MIYQNPQRPDHRRRSNFQVADGIFNSFQMASKQLGIGVQEPHWIEVENEGNYAEVKE